MMQTSLVHSVRELAVGVIAQARSRLQLLGLELAEERERVIALLIAALMSCFFVWLAVVFGALMIVARYWDTPYRLQAIGWLAVAALVLAVAGIAFFVVRVRAPVALFAHSMAELDKDRHALETLE